MKWTLEFVINRWIFSDFQDTLTYQENEIPQAIPLEQRKSNKSKTKSKPEMLGIRTFAKTLWNTW